MATFDIGKEINEIEEPKLLPNGEYILELTQDPTQEDNAKLKEQKDSGSPVEGAGQNIVLRMKVVESEPEYNGRMFTSWLPLPNASDEGKFDGRGQAVVDAKADRIARTVLAFNKGGVVGRQAELFAGQRARFTIVQGIDRRDNQTLRNELAAFEIPRPVEDGGGLGL